ncbi:MFS transporter [Bradyrhizobium liaoningense]|uniref:MFS transporter n=1 Tax=Bradyrhizobium liaoningense TaxID=43992 RepID=UPI001BAC3B14|nr:MFS transporter [Bradyrhizobium liaoningense]MBR0859106.1 MFS transporter [Bradyrhizobium liaoningense]
MEDIERDTMRRVRSRIFYCLFLMFLLNQIDRTNVGFAALQMNSQLNFTAEVYGFGTGLFFFSYLLAEMPSNLMLERFGPRIWLSRICISWGVIATLMAFVHDATSFYILRFLLGAAEAGFAPGSIYYINLWAPKRHRAKSIVVTALAIPLSVIIGGPVAGLFLSIDNVAGLAGWQWLFLAEGLPSVIFGLFTLWFLTDQPKDAHWLSSAQRSWLIRELDSDAKEASQHGISTLRSVLRSGRVWRTGIAFFCVTLTTWGLGFWLPQIIKQVSGLTNLQVSLLAALPFVGLATGFLVSSWHSDRVQERQWHFVGGALVGAAGLLISATVPSAALAFCGLIVTGFGLGCALAVFFSIPMGFLSGTAVAGGLAFINMIGNSAGFFASYIIGWLRGTTGSFNAALAFLCVGMVLGALLLAPLGLDGAAKWNASRRRMTSEP